MPFSGIQDSRYFRKFIYSRVGIVKTYQCDYKQRQYFTCCAFSSCSKWLFMGTESGQLNKCYLNLKKDLPTDVQTYSCHTEEMTHCEPSRDGSLLLTSSSESAPDESSILWSMNDLMTKRATVGGNRYTEFSKRIQSMIIGTDGRKAELFDLETGVKLSTFYDGNSNDYYENKATFNYTDNLVLNDGVLWDVKTSKAVHKFDRFRDAITSLFHPTGLEVIIDSEVWDLRTFRLLQTVPALNSTEFKFNHAGDIIYASGDNFLITMDAADYSTIATIKVGGSITGLCTDLSDSHLALIEGRLRYKCCIYKVGQKGAGGDQPSVTDVSRDGDEFTPESTDQESGSSEESDDND